MSAINSGRSEDLVRGMIFATLIVSNISIVLTNRSRNLPISLCRVKASELESERSAIVSGLTLNIMSARLISLGIRKGVHIQKLRKTTGGGILFRVEEHRVVLHKSLAELVEVREEA